MLRNFTKGRDLIRPAATRFATSYLTLSCLNELKGALMNMFSSNEWKEIKFSSTKEGKQVAKKVLDNRFWKNIVLCLKAAAPLIKVFRVVDSDKMPAMGFIYEEMNRAKEKIKTNFNNVKKSYEPIFKIIDERWEGQLHRPLHAADHYLNPRWHYSPSFNKNYDVKRGLYDCLERLVPDRVTRHNIDRQIIEFHKATGMFGLQSAKDNRDKMAPADWWYAYGDDCPELKDFAIRILSLTCSSSGCERNWSAFEMVHTKKRNRLYQKKMNDLVFVMTNSKLQNKQGKNSVIEFDDIHSDDEWITEPSNAKEIDEENEEVEQPPLVVDENVNDDANVVPPGFVGMDMVVDLDFSCADHGHPSLGDDGGDEDNDKEDGEDSGDKDGDEGGDDGGDDDDDDDDDDEEKTFEELC